MAARELSAFRLRTEIIVDNARANAQLQQTAQHVDKLTGGFKGMLGAFSAEAGQGIAKLEGLTGSFGKLGSAVGLAGGPLGIAATAITGIGAAAVGAGAALFELAEKSAKIGKSIFEIHEKTNLTTETISAFRVAAEQTGQGIEFVGNKLAGFNVALGKAQFGDKAMVTAFREMGVEIHQGVEPALAQFLKKFAEMGPTAQRNALEAKLFRDRSGELIPVLQQMGASMDVARKRAEELGLSFSEKDAKAAKDFDDTLKLLILQFEGVAQNISKGYAPEILRAMKGLSQSLKENQQTFREWGTAIADVFRGMTTSAQSEFGKTLGELSKFSIEYLSGAGLIIKGLHALGVSEREKAPIEDVYGPGGVMREMPGRGRPYTTPGTLDAAAKEKQFQERQARAKEAAKKSAQERKRLLADEARELKQTTKAYDDYLERLNKELLTLKLEDKAFFQQREVFKDERVALDLNSKAYDKFSQAQKHNILQAANLLSNEERASAFSKIFTQSLDDERRATVELYAPTDKLTKAYDELAKKSAWVSVAIDANQEKEARQVVFFKQQAEQAAHLDEELDRMIELLPQLQLAAPAAPVGFLETLRAEEEEADRIGKKIEAVLGPPPPMKASLKGQWQQLADTLRGTFANAFDTLINKGWKGLMEMMKNQFKQMLVQLVAALAASGLAKALSGLFGGVMGGQQKKKGGFFGSLFGGLLSMGLSFIPGIGPLLGGLGGLFGGGGSGGGPPIFGGLGSIVHAQSGARASAGRPYIVGERRPELFVPETSGWIHPSVAGQGAGSAAHMQILERVAAALERFESMPPDHVVMTGARGLPRALDFDAGLINKLGRRLNLA